MTIRNELRRLVAEQAVDMLGTRVDHSEGEEWTPRHRATHQDARRLEEGAALTARREELLRTYPFASARERRTYELHAVGMPDIGIAKRTHRSKSVVQRIIARVERSIYADAVVPYSPGFRVWQYWLQGWCECHIAIRCALPADYVRGVVEGAIRSWRRTPPTAPQAMAVLCRDEFVTALGALTPAAALEAAGRDPELAEMLERLGLVA